MRLENLTEKVRASIVESILSGKYAPGDQVPPERELAEQTGTSRITVRRAYSQLEARGIIVRRPHNGTRVAETFRGRTGPLESIGVITTLPHRFSGLFVEAVSRRCSQEDALLTLGIPDPDTAEEQLKLAIRMVSHGVRDIIIWGANRNFDFKVFERLRILGVNLVFFDQVIPGDYADYVGLDNACAVQELFECALSRGAQDFVFLTFDDQDVDTNKEREEAFNSCLSSHHLQGRTLRISSTATHSERHRIADDACRPGCAVIAVNSPLLLQLFSAPPPQARLYCVDYIDQLAEIGAVGYRQPISEMADIAVNMLLEQRRKGDKWHSVIRRVKGELAGL